MVNVTLSLPSMDTLPDASPPKVIVIGEAHLITDRGVAALPFPVNVESVDTEMIALSVTVVLLEIAVSKSFNTVLNVVPVELSKRLVSIGTEVSATKIRKGEINQKGKKLNTGGQNPFTGEGTEIK